MAIGGAAGAATEFVFSTLGRGSQMEKHGTGCRPRRDEETEEADDDD